MSTIYRLAIRSLTPDYAGIPEMIRLRSALKVLLRSCGFRCLAIEPQEDQFSDGSGI